MATNVLLPQWGMEMAEGTIVKWLKQEGDAIAEGELLVAVETAKLETEMESIASGIVAHILVPEGATVPIRTVLAVIAEPGENVPRPETTPFLPSPVAAVAAPPAQPAATSGPAPRSGGSSEGRDNVQVVPAARRLAQQNGIDLAEVQGTGPGGRILIADVERAIKAQAQPVSQAVPLQGMRRTIATRMMQSLQTMAQVTLTTEADVTDAMTLREGLNRRSDGSNLSPLHMAVKAAGKALREHPRLNAVQEPDGYRLMDQVNIGVAVSLEEGLITAVIRDADAKGLDQVAAESRELARKTREGLATPEDVTGGTFTITNLGVYDVDGFTPIINPPQVAILGLGRLVEKPVVRNGQLAVGRTMFLSLTFDHRIVDGAPAAEFLQAIKDHLEAPWWMLR